MTEGYFSSNFGGSLVQAKQMSKYGEVKGPKGQRLDYKPGDWVVRGGPLGYRVFSDQAFNIMYRSIATVNTPEGNVL